MRNTSLDEFLDADEAPDSGAGSERVAPESRAERDGESNATTTEPDSDAGDSGTEPIDDTDPVEPAVSTFDWTPSGAECDDCGAVVERRWRDDARMVCPDCKTW